MIVKLTLFFDSRIKCHRDDFVYYPRLKDLREDKELKQKEVAAVLGIDQRVYSNYEIGKREIPTSFVMKLADLYCTSTDYILGRTNKNIPLN